MVAKLFAVSDLHVGHRGNLPVIEGLRREGPDDWLIVAGDVAERTEEIRTSLELLAKRFAKVIWVPGNHELWTTVKDPVQLHGVELYDYLVEMCREIGVVTPEDPYPVWEGDGGPAVIVPMFLLYDYSWLPDGAADKAAGLEIGRESGVVATDEFLLSPQPYGSREAWCRARVKETRTRLDALDRSLPTVLVNHFPLVREPTRVLIHPEFAMWCGTDATAAWHVRYRAVCAVYGHLHIPRTTYYDGVRFEEVSVGYPREWRQRGLPEPVLRQILPAPVYPPGALNKWGGHFHVSEEQEAEMERLRARLAKRGSA
ncbi:metallophosphoesterase family protein [Tomitella biformata]|uniref:metallophosphoesterase family protein n=1 Tax=Tomitella biformata TaxID=630403 RepID=UPI000464FAE6|nr:metallophosphoesterase [Tomitella biformata]